MFTVNAIHKELGGRQVLGGISFAVNRGEVIGVVGPNGSGKTTLLRIIAGLLQPDSGRVQTEPGATIAYLPQGVSYAADRSVGEAFPRIFASADDDSLGALAADLAANATPEAEAAYAHALEQLEVAGRWDAHALREELGIATVSGDALTRTLSGGELTKLGLIDAVVATPSILLLDEPTNHLDLGGMEWLERHLHPFRGAAVVVSHDRALLDACATAILELDPRSGTAEMFAGNYAAYAAEKARREEEHWRRYELQQREERQLKRAISSIESRARGIENRTIDFYFRKRAAKTARRAVTLKARLERQHAGKDHVDRPEKPAAGFYSSFQAADSGAARVLTVEHLNLEAGGRHLQRDLSFVVGRKQCVVVAGPNGCGKTTLLRTILGELPASAGRVSLNPSVKVGYLAQHAGGADNGPDALLTPVEALRRESKLSETDAYNFLHRFVMGHDQLRTPMGRLSYGERRRIALARLIAGGAAFLLLDEPTNHLDLPSQEAFDTAFGAFDGASLVVTHDRYFIERFADRVLELPSPPR